MLKKIRMFFTRREVKEIRSYQIDWSDFYIVNDVKSSLSPEEYFVKHVYEKALVVPGVLDVQFYLQQYPDVRKEKVNPLIHFMRYGRYENRKAMPSLTMSNPEISEEQVKHDFFFISQQDIDWKPYIERHSLSSREEAIAHYCRSWWKLLPLVDHVIDTKYYIKKYPDILKDSQNPLVHYMTHGKSEGRQGFEFSKIDDACQVGSKETTTDELRAHSELEIRLRQLKIDWHKVSYVCESTNQKVDPIKYILENHDSMAIKIPGFFDSKLYLELYPDIAEAPISPLRHYVFHGITEGRVGYFNVQNHFRLGDHEFDNSKPLYVVVSHESSATGAPLVGFNLSQQLSKNYNVINIILRKSKLHRAFEKECVASFSELDVQSAVLAKRVLLYISKRFTKIDVIICNSVETGYVIQAANELDIPSVALVHEFTEYTRPKGKATNLILNADKVVVPANVIKESICRELNLVRGIKLSPNNIVIQPQGRLPFIPEGHGNSDAISELKAKLNLGEDFGGHVLIGAGYVQIRKGVDIFISAAKRIKELAEKPCKFVWVGEGYEPDKDLNYSNWLKTQITLSGLEDDFVFLGHQGSLDNILQIGDVFCMTSRLDPFPNVVIDALAADLHVACFEKSTGCAEFLNKHKANCTIVDYLDTEMFAVGVVEYLNNSPSRTGINKQLVNKYLNFSNYTDGILEAAKSAIDFQGKVASIVTSLTNNGKFDAEFYDPTLSEKKALKEYVQLGLKGIHLNNPCPGFNEKLWLSNFGNGSEYNVALDLVIKEGREQTHEVCQIYPRRLEEKPNFKYAIHLHLFYPDLAADFANYFSCLPAGFDLYVTHMDIKDEEEIRESFSLSGVNSLHTIVIENKGRNLGAFINVFKNYLNHKDYDIVGHFQSKKSIAVDGGMGDRWRKFLLDSLIGNEVQVMQVLSNFKRSEIGLVFAEDRHCVDSADNKKFISELYSEMGIKGPLDCYLFPVGSMFWARLDALRPLLSLENSFYELDEPIPYDGTYLHALERIFPVVVNSQGYQVITVHNKKLSW